MDWFTFYCGAVAGWLLVTVIELILRERRMRQKKYYFPKDLLAVWRHRARHLMWDAPKDKSMVTAKDAMIHEAIIYSNCMAELADALREYVDPEVI